MDIEVLPKIQRDLWNTLSKMKEMMPFYLAGGTAIALHLGHRESIDFDFFRPDPFKSEEIVRALSTKGTVRIENQAEDSLVAYVSDVKFSCFCYPYSLIAPLHPCGGISVCDLKDLVAMKLVAISQRGAKKDFIDLHAILRAGWNFEAVFECVDLKYPNQRHNRLHLLKSLVYFQDAEHDPMPKMLTPTSWKIVRRDLESAVRKFMLHKR